MGVFSHVRWGSSARYTAAQAREFQRLRAAYQTHMAVVAGAEYPALLQLQKNPQDPPVPVTNGNALPAALPVREVQPGAHALQPFTRGLLDRIGIFEKQRGQRRWGKGHANDPTTLFIYYLREEVLALGVSPCNAATLARIRALGHFLGAIQRERIFSHEPEGQGSLSLLLHNGSAELALLEAHVQAEIGLEGAREHFTQLKTTLHHVLDAGVQYLFYALCDTDRTRLSLSLLSAPAALIDNALHRSLHTRAGALLKNLVQHPAVVAAAFPHSVSAVTRFGKPLGLFGEREGTPFLDDSGQANSCWLHFLQGTPTEEAQIPSALRSLPVGVVGSSLREIPSEEASTALATYIRLHGLLLTFATFQGYIQQCWQLAGFGGDQLVYGRLAEALTTVLTELRGFTAALHTALQECQDRCNALETKALDQNKDKTWQANYQQAKTHRTRLESVLASSDTMLKALIQHTQDGPARARRDAAGREAYARLQGASTFLSQARREIGLCPLAEYPGFPSMTAEHINPEAAPSSIRTLEALILALLPQAPQQVLHLTQLSRNTPRVLPWLCFRGSYQRIAYLQNRERLVSLADGIARLERYPQYARTAEGQTQRKELVTRCQGELARIEQLSKFLYWPLHRKSLAFFVAWGEVFEQNLERLAVLEASVAQEPVQDTAFIAHALDEAALQRIGQLQSSVEAAESRALAAETMLESAQDQWERVLVEEAYWTGLRAERNERLAVEIRAEEREAKEVVECKALPASGTQRDTLQQRETFFGRPF